VCCDGRGEIGGQTGTKWRDAGLLQGDVWLCNFTLEIRDYKRDNFFNFLFCLDSAG